MKKILLAAVIGLSLIGLEVSADTSNSKFFNDEALILGTKTGTMFIYNRKQYKLKNQDIAELSQSIAIKSCMNREANRYIATGHSIIGVYIYQDGAISVEVDKCK